MTKAWIKSTIKKLDKVSRRNRAKFKVTKAPERQTIQVPKLKPVPKMELAIKPDYDRLFKLLEMRTYSKSPAQDKFIDILSNHFSSLSALVEKDSYGNLYVTKGNAKFYPCVVGHTDINQTVRSNVKIMSAYPWIFGFDVNKAEQSGIGADDKVGVYFAVHMFDLFDNIKLFFPKDEEVGLIGTYKADKNFFSDCSMLVQLDRRSYTNDLITYTNGIKVCSDEFLEAAGPIMDKYMYARNDGSCTDIGGIKKYDTVHCVAMNVSCGYINEHSDEEMISMPHFENAINFGYELLQMGVDQVWSHTAEQESYKSSYFGGYGTYGSYSSYYKGSSYDLFDDIQENKSIYTVDSPGGPVKLSITDKHQDEYISEYYSEYADMSYRTNKLYHALSYYEQEFNEVSNREVDECIAQGVCPSCWNEVHADNRLLLNTYCECCDSTFNIPVEDDEVYGG